MNKKLLKITATAGLAALLTGCFKESKPEVKTIYLPSDCERVAKTDAFGGYEFIYCFDKHDNIKGYRGEIFKGSDGINKYLWTKISEIPRIGVEGSYPEDCEKPIKFDVDFGMKYLTCQNSEGETLYKKINDKENWEKRFIFKRPEMIKPEAENSTK